MEGPGLTTESSRPTYRCRRIDQRDEDENGEYRQSHWEIFTICHRGETSFRKVRGGRGEGAGDGTTHLMSGHRTLHNVPSACRNEET